VQKKILARRKRRLFRVRNRVRQQESLPRVSVARSLKYTSGQIVDDVAQATLASFSSQLLKEFSGDKVAAAKQAGQKLAEKAVEKGVNRVFFDRGCHLYHGRVKAFADGLREGGLEF